MEVTEPRFENGEWVVTITWMGNSEDYTFTEQSDADNFYRVNQVQAELGQRGD